MTPNDKPTAWGVEDEVHTIKGAKFRGRVKALYEVEPGNWRADVYAEHPWFEGTLHVYPTSQLALAPAETDQLHNVHRKAVDTVIAAVQAYLPPDGIDKDEFVSRVIGAVDNPDVALATRRRSCSCVDVEIQAYRSQGLVKIPEHMQALRDHRRASGNPMWEWLSIDGCLIAEIRDLWDAGIRTTGCCCGHNVADPFIGVEFDDIEKMKALGYQVAPNPSRPGDEDSFYPKSIRRYDH